MLTALASQPQLAQAERIYRCPQPNAPPLFSGTPCNSAHQLAPVMTNSYKPPALTATEQRQLDLLSKRSARLHNRQQAKRKKKSAGHAAGLSKRSPTSTCARHQEALRALQNRRRKGYKLSEAARLEHQEQSLRQNIRLSC